MSEYQTKETKPKAPEGYRIVGNRKRLPEKGDLYIKEYGRPGTVTKCASSSCDVVKWIVEPIQSPLRDYQQEAIDTARALYGSPRTITLPAPKEGYEWVASTYGDIITHRQRPITKHLDWSKVGPYVLVLNHHGKVLPRSHTASPQELFAGTWQAHIGGDPCPVDADAVMVEVRGCGDTSLPARCFKWSVDQIYRVTGLVEGYQYAK